MSDQLPKRSFVSLVLRLLPRLALIVGAVYLLHRMIGAMIDWTEYSAQNDMVMISVLALVIVAYALLIAIPFVPGIEIGIALIALRGAEIGPFVYLATVAGLALAFLVGYCLPYPRLSSGLRWLHLERAAALVDQAASLPPSERLQALRSGRATWIPSWAISGRYIMLAILINLPGSGLIGGGGGLSFSAGLSRVFRPMPTLLTLALAVAPAPLLVWYLGWDPAELLSP